MIIVRAVLNPQSFEWLDDHRILLHRRGLRRLRPGEALEFVDRVEIEPHVGVYKGGTLCSMGSLSYASTSLPPKISIGRCCSIGPEVALHLAGHPISHVSTSDLSHDPSAHLFRVFAADHGLELKAVPFKGRPPVRIEHDVWIGARSAILPGVVLGTGCVVAAGSVVTRSVGPYEVVAGNPARVIRKRFSDDLVEGLLQSAWWDYNLSDFADLPMQDPAQFLDAFMRRKPDLEPYRPALVRMKEMPREA